MNLKNKVAYITGGTKGIGKGTAETLLNAGMRVAISGRDLKNVKKTAESLGNSDKIIGIQSDVSNFEDEKQAVEQIIQHFGQLDVVLANAGTGIFAPVDELNINDWNLMIQTNLNGVFHTLKASVEELKKSEGYYITLSSLAGTNFFENGA
ncbi:MAG: SDR family NAD(P)-dependent oxidoreductase, partial [Weeksellaceae bacterium]|nr:SDR family NAD(P)-dependent oxidoreductase [Weeksellaceae bacterium]